MPSLGQRVSSELLPHVDQPGQYIGGELNQLPTPGDWERADLRIAVAFPDTYAIGMSHLGCLILYWQINHTPGCCAERVYCPWTDADAVMRARGIELFTWDTRQPVASADILAVSLQYELACTGLLALLDLARIPRHASARDDSHPLVIVGGPQADNPEPIAPFVDLVVLGDGEPAMAAILDACKQMKAGGTRRREIIPLLAQRFPWVYAPSLYDVTYEADGTVGRITPSHPGLPATITRCVAASLDDAPFPVRPLVPHVEVVHDRMAIEIMRGCPNRCRFCHAGYTKHPLRVRSVERILAMAEEMYASTGTDELGLLSLSTADYPDLASLAKRANERFAPRQVNISLPSLRVDKMLQEIPWLVSGVRKGGLTLAVEAACDDMRAAIRKKVTDGNLLDGVRQAYEAGWRAVKLYFMCGFPGEQGEDIDGIIDLSRQVSEARRPLKGAPGVVNASVGWLVPKPHTPLQWSAQPTADYFLDAHHRLKSRLGRKIKAVKVRTPSVERSVLEAVLARGDRKLAAVIEKAYELGARFDGWEEHFKPAIWQAAFESCSVDPAFYAHRERPISETLPWSHLITDRASAHLARQYEDLRSTLRASRPDAFDA